MKSEKSDIRIYNLIFGCFLSFIILNSCAIRTVGYNSAKIVKKENKGYQVYLDSKEIRFENIFLNSQNVNHVEIMQREKKLIISRKQNNDLLSFTDLVSKGIIDKPSEIKLDDYLLIINGIPYDLEESRDLYFEKGVIKDVKWLDPSQMKENTIFHLGRILVLLIITKNT